MADWHFAPTQKARQNLESEGINKDIFVVGNTVIDALFLALSIIDRKGEEEYYRYFRNLNIDLSKKIILVTSHRRESFGEPIKNICIAIKEIAQAFSDIEIIYPVHFNPNIRNIVREILQYQDRIHLIEPLDYSYMIWLMKMSYIILTDSGGIQEEAPSLNKPVLIMREVTERTEGIENGVSMLVGTKKEDIVKATSMLINDNQKYNLMINKPNPYGDGMASSKIVNYLLETS